MKLTSTSRTKKKICPALKRTAQALVPKRKCNKILCNYLMRLWQITAVLRNVCIYKPSPSLSEYILSFAGGEGLESGRQKSSQLQVRANVRLRKSTSTNIIFTSLSVQLIAFSFERLTATHMLLFAQWV